MKRLMILGAGVAQIPVIQKAKKVPCHTIVLDYNDQAPGIPYADEFYSISTVDKEKVLALAKEKKIDGILTTSDYPVNVVAYVSRELGLPGMSETLAKICTNKYLQRTYFQQHQIAVPRFKQITDIDELDNIDYFPCIIKPVDSSASRGVKRVYSVSELRNQFQETKSFSLSGKVIVEEFIEGKEYSVETFSQHGNHHVIQVTEKQTIGADKGYFVEDTHIEPALLSTAERQKVEDYVYSVLKKMDVDECPSHIELKINERGIFIIEMACRLGGDYITADLVPLSTTVDMLDNLIKLSLGMDINIVSKPNGVSSVQFINNLNYNKCISFIEQNTISMVRYEVYPFTNREIKDSLDRLGYIILHTDTRQQMDDILLMLK